MPHVCDARQTLAAQGRTFYCSFWLVPIPEVNAIVVGWMVWISIKYILEYRINSYIADDGKVRPRILPKLQCQKRPGFNIVRIGFDDFFDAVSYLIT